MRLRSIVILIAVISLAVGAYTGLTVADVPKAATLANTYWSKVEQEFRHRAEQSSDVATAIASVNPSQAELIGKVKASQAAVLALPPEPGAPADPARFRQFMKVQDSLSQTLGLVLDMLRTYPDTARTEPVAKVFAELELRESHIVVARGDYVSVAQAHNALLQSPPQSWVAAMFHPKTRPLVASFDPGQ